jgi:dCMP deaminase
MVDNKGESTRVRPEWDEYFIKIAKVTSERSACERLQVGCVLVKDNRIVSQGYNGFLPGCPHESIVKNGHEQATVHAEQNAIADCAKRGAACGGTIAYITHYPCIICTRMLLAAGIKEIKYIEDYKNDELVTQFCNQLCVPICKI